MLLAVSICHLVLAIVYDGQCPAAPFLTIILIITGIIGVILSIIALIIYRFDTYDGSNKWNLLFTFIYLIGSRIATSIIVFRFSSPTNNQNHCAPVLYWTSTLLIIISYSIIVITCCLLINLILLQKRHNKYKKPINNRTSTT